MDMLAKLLCVPCIAERCPTLLNLLVIIVGGIPIAMPTVLSVTLALGSFKLASEGAIVARMSAVEEMAGTDILCSDKTGAHCPPCGNRWANKKQVAAALFIAPACIVPNAVVE